MQGIRSVPAGPLSYASDEVAQPLSPLEEAVLIAATGTTGVTMPDMPIQTPEGRMLFGSPMLQVVGRAASSPDNAQPTHFFLINDSGTYLLRTPRQSELDHVDEVTPEVLMARADAAKIRVLDHRLDCPREFPCYIGRNRYVSNLPGSTILVPVIDLTRQYINGLLYLLSQDDGHRPTPIDDWNFYRKAGVGKWVKNGFLNPDLPLPLGYLGTFRMHVESDLLFQNLLLTIQAMGLGGWVHAAFPDHILLGDPAFAKYGSGLGFRWAPAKRNLMRILRTPITPLPAWRANPVGLDGKLEAYCPPYYPNMSAAVEAILREKYGPTGPYSDPALFDKVFKPGLAQQFLDEVPHYSDDVIECVKDVCNYIYDTYGRFPAHADAIHVPGLWVQAHHLDLKYYDHLYQGGYSSTQANHHDLWHGNARD